MSEQDYMVRLISDLSEILNNINNTKNIYLFKEIVLKKDKAIITVNIYAKKNKSVIFEIHFETTKPEKLSLFNDFIKKLFE